MEILVVNLQVGDGDVVHYQMQLVVLMMFIVVHLDTRVEQEVCIDLFYV